MTEWDCLSDVQQLDLTQTALRYAVHVISRQAYSMAEEIEGGGLPDLGGADTLRLLATALRVAGEAAPVAAPGLAELTVAGHA